MFPFQQAEAEAKAAGLDPKKARAAGDAAGPEAGDAAKGNAVFFVTSRAFNWSRS